MIKNDKVIKSYTSLVKFVAVFNSQTLDTDSTILLLPSVIENLVVVYEGKGIEKSSFFEIFRHFHIATKHELIHELIC